MLSRPLKWQVLALATLTAVGLLVLHFNSQTTKSPTHLNSLKRLRVVTYSSFAAYWGPGPLIAKRFSEKFPDTQVEYIEADDAGLLMTKADLFHADVVLGLDQWGILFAQDRKWRPLAVSSADLLTPAFKNDAFLAFDWAPLGFVYRTSGKRALARPPESLDDLLDSRFSHSLALENPRTSSPGLQFLIWLDQQRPGHRLKETLLRLKPNIYNISGSWSTTYGLLQQELASLAYSYLTSPLYHRLHEGDESYFFATLKEPPPLQVEWAGVLAECGECERAVQFVTSLLEEKNQQDIAQRNWMLPVARKVELPASFAKVLEVALGELRHSNEVVIPHLESSSAKKKRDELFRTWNLVFE